MRNETLLRRQLEFETAYPLQRVMDCLFRHHVQGIFERMADLVERAYTETQEQYRAGSGSAPAVCSGFDG